MTSRTAIFLFVLLSALSFSSRGHEAHKHAGAQAETSGEARSADQETSRNYFTDLALVNQRGERVRFYSDVLKDKVVLISTIYTNCIDACPLVIHRLSKVKDSLGEVFGKQVFFVSMSVDPARDTPQALAKYAAQHKAEHPGWMFLTGEKANVDRILARLGLRADNPEAHSTLLLAGNVRMRHWTKIGPAASEAAVAAKLKGLLRQSSATSYLSASAGSR